MSREGGGGYKAGKSAYEHLLDLASDEAKPAETRRWAIEILGRIGTEFETGSLLKIASKNPVAKPDPAGSEPPSETEQSKVAADSLSIRTTAYLAALSIAARTPSEANRAEKAGTWACNG